jgi:hypothetical protein
MYYLLVLKFSRYRMSSVPLEVLQYTNLLLISVLHKW